MNSYETDYKNKLITTNYVARFWKSVHEGNLWSLKFNRNYPTAHANNKQTGLLIAKLFWDFLKF